MIEASKKGHPSTEKKVISDQDAKDWDGMQPLEPTPDEKFKIDELIRYNPKLDYLMALVLVKSSEEDLKKLVESRKERPDPPSSTVIPDAFTLD